MPPPAEVYDLAAHEAVMDRMFRDDITPDELYAAFSHFTANESEIKDELTKTHTVAQLKRKLVYASGKKAHLVGTVYENMLGRYAAAATDTIGYSPMSETYADAVDRVVSRITAEELTAHSAERKAKRDEFVKSLTDPETLEEFKTFVYRRGVEPMTDDQLLNYDRLIWKDNREKREAIVQAAINREVRETQALTAEHAGLLKVRQDWHGRRECNIWVVGLAEYIEDKTVWKAMNAQARQFRARWSKYGDPDDHGWIFWNEEDALAFMKLAGGDVVDFEQIRADREIKKQAKAADRLAQYATYHYEDADAALTADRLTNTWRRVNLARNAEANAREWKRFAQIVGDVALAMEIGELQAMADVRFASQLALLIQLIDESWRNATRWENENNYVRPEDRRPRHENDIRHALLPLPRLDVRESEEVARHLHGRQGVSVAKRILQDGVKQAREADRHWMTIQLSDVGEVMKALPKSGSKEFAECFDNWKRMVAIGVTSPEELRHTLRELHRYLVASDQADPVREAIRELVGGGKIPGFFPTPAGVRDILEPWLPCPGPAPDGLPMKILEPQAGIGNILDWLVLHFPEAHFTSHEINWNLVDILRMKGHETVVVDYLVTETVPCFDLIVSNAPFENDQAIDHFHHSLAQLNEGGRFIAIMPDSAFTGSGTKKVAFQQFIETFATHQERLPDRSFKESGTSTAARYVVVDAGSLRS